MIQRKAAVIRTPPYPWPRAIGNGVAVGEHQPIVQAVSTTITLYPGSRYSGPGSSETATLDAGTISLDVTTASGSEFCLRRLVSGDVIVPLHLISSPAFSLAYRSDDNARVLCQRGRTMAAGDTVDIHQPMLEAMHDLLGACIRMIHELACLPASHRLYCELVRLSGVGPDDRTPAPFAMPTHAALAARLCTTRETVSRELSFLRRNGVIANGKEGAILKLDFLLNGIASALNLPDADDVWDAIGVGR